jgi:hypothetical protein
MGQHISSRQVERSSRTRHIAGRCVSSSVGGPLWFRLNQRHVEHKLGLATRTPCRTGSEAELTGHCTFADISAISRTRLWLVDRWEHRDRRPSREPGNLHTTCGRRVRRPSFSAPWPSATVLVPQSRLLPPTPCDPTISETPPLPNVPR